MILKFLKSLLNCNSMDISFIQAAMLDDKINERELDSICNRVEEEREIRKILLGFSMLNLKPSQEGIYEIEIQEIFKHSVFPSIDKIPLTALAFAESILKDIPCILLQARIADVLEWINYKNDELRYGYFALEYHIQIFQQSQNMDSISPSAERMLYLYKKYRHYQNFISGINIINLILEKLAALLNDSHLSFNDLVVSIKLIQLLVKYDFHPSEISSMKKKIIKKISTEQLVVFKELCH